MPFMENFFCKIPQHIFKWATIKSKLRKKNERPSSVSLRVFFQISKKPSSSHIPLSTFFACSWLKMTRCNTEEPFHRCKFLMERYLGEAGNKEMQKITHLRSSGITTLGDKREES